MGKPGSILVAPYPFPFWWCKNKKDKGEKGDACGWDHDDVEGNFQIDEHFYIVGYKGTEINTRWILQLP